MSGRRYIAGRDRETAKAGRCTRRACDTLLTPSIGKNGVVTFDCAPCARNARGLCRDCPSPLPPPRHPRGKKPDRMRCDPCTLKHSSKRKKAAYHLDPEHHRKLKRESSRRPHVKARQKRYQQQWQKDHPYTADEYGRLYARTWMRDFLSDPAVRDRVNARRRELAAERRALVVACGEHKRLYPKPFGPRPRKAA
jgi:hypothetical protein